MNIGQVKEKEHLMKMKDSYLWQIHKLQGQVSRVNEQLKALDTVIDLREITVSNHAIERFKERVIDIPTKKIKQMLSGETLTQAYRKRGDGRYGVENMPHVVMHIRDFTVTTVINTNDPEKKLMVLKEYMSYYVDELCLKYGENDQYSKPMKFRKFNNMYWRNQEN